MSQIFNADTSKLSFKKPVMGDTPSFEDTLSEGVRYETAEDNRTIQAQSFGMKDVKKVLDGITPEDRAAWGRRMEIAAQHQIAPYLADAQSVIDKRERELRQTDRMMKEAPSSHSLLSKPYGMFAAGDYTADMLKTESEVRRWHIPGEDGISEETLSVFDATLGALYKGGHEVMQGLRTLDADAINQAVNTRIHMTDEEIEALPEDARAVLMDIAGDGLEVTVPKDSKDSYFTQWQKRYDNSGTVAQIVADVLRSTPTTATSMLGGLVAGPAGAFAMASATIYGMSLEQYQQIPGVDMNKARMAAIGNALIQGAMEAYGGMGLLKSWAPKSAKGKVLKEFLGGMGREGATEYMQEYPDYIFGELAKGGTAESQDMASIIRHLFSVDFQKDALYSGFIGAIAGGVMEAPSLPANLRATRRQVAAVAESKLAKDRPFIMRELLKTLVRDGGSAKEIHVKAADLEGLLQSGGQQEGQEGTASSLTTDERQELLREIGVSEQDLAAAKESDGTVSIPFENVHFLMGEEGRKKLDQIVQVSEEDPTKGTAEVLSILSEDGPFAGKSAEEISDLLKIADEERSELDKFAAQLNEDKDAQAVAERESLKGLVRDSIMEATKGYENAYTQKQAQAYADVVDAAVATFASRLGITYGEAWQKIGPTILRETTSQEEMAAARMAAVMEALGDDHPGLIDLNANGTLNQGADGVRWGINVQNTKFKFVDNILNGQKTVETRTLRAWKMMQDAGIKVGDRVAIVEKGVVKGYVTISGVIEYADREAFGKDFERHKVEAGSKYDFDDAKGKVGLELSDPELLETPYSVPKLNRPQGYRALQQSADKVLGNTVELNVESARDPESQKYMREQMKKRGFSDQDADSFIALIEGIADQVMDVAQGNERLAQWNEQDVNNKTRRVYDLSLGLVPTVSAFKKNGEYPVNVDMGTVCTKREAADALIQILTDEGLAQNLGPTQIEALKDLLKQEGFLTACDICFVETKRSRMLTDANKFSYEWKSVLLALGINDAVNVGEERTLTKEQEAILHEMAGDLTTEEASAVIEKATAAKQKTSKNGKPVVLSNAQIAKAVDAAIWKKMEGSFSKEERDEMREVAGNAKNYKKLVKNRYLNRAFERYVPSDRWRTKNEKGDDLDTGITSSKMQMIAKLMGQDSTLVNNFRAEWLLTTAGTDWLMRRYGPTTGMRGVLSAMFGAATAKPLEGFNVYDPLSWKVMDKSGKAWEAFKQKLYDIGGARAQSFTDFNPILVMDYIQFFADMQIRQLPLQMYTKVPALVELFGQCGIMMNMSLVPDIVEGISAEHAGLKPDGKGGWTYAWGVESFDVDKAMKYRADKAYNGCVGTIAVGVSDAHIEMMLDDDTIDMIIPFHKSGMPFSVQVKTGLDKAKDYTDVQGTCKPSTAKDFNYNAALQELKDPRKAANAYLEWCDAKGYRPKFEKWKGHKNYYKLLEDFRGYDIEGNPVIQGPVRLNFPEDFGERLKSALEERGYLDEKLRTMRDNTKLIEEAKRRVSKQRLDGDMRDAMMKALNTALGSGSVTSLRQSEFDAELLKRMTDSEGAASASARMEQLKLKNGIVYGFAHNGKIWLNENAFNANTPAHEFSHIWAKVAQAKNPKLWNEGKDLLKQSDTWKEVVNDPLYKDILGNEDAIASEVLARIVGEENEDFVRQLVDPQYKMGKNEGLKAKIMEWIRKLFDDVRSLFSDVNGRPLTYEEFVRMPLKDLWEETRAKEFAANAAQVLNDKPQSMAELMATRDEVQKRIAEEQKSIKDAYNRVFNHPLIGTEDEVLATIRPEDIEREFVIQRGSDVTEDGALILKNGRLYGADKSAAHGLVKVIYGHGERFNKERKNGMPDITLEDLIKIPEIVREYAPAEVTRTRRTWRIEREDGYVYVLSVGDGHKYGIDRLVTYYIGRQLKGKGERPLSKKINASISDSSGRQQNLTRDTMSGDFPFVPDSQNAMRVGTRMPDNGDSVNAQEDVSYFDAIERGDMDAVRAMVEQKARENGFADAIPEQTNAFKVRTGAAPTKTKKVYKVFTVSPDGSPTALFVAGDQHLPQGVWLDAIDSWHIVDAKSGLPYVPSTQNPYTDGGKTGTQVAIREEDVDELIKRGFIAKPKPGKPHAKSVTGLAYRPGWHFGSMPFFPQGGKMVPGANHEVKGKVSETGEQLGMVHRWNQVVFECELDASHDYTDEARSQEKAKNKNGKVNARKADLQYMPEGGYYEYTTNPANFGKPERGLWYISGSLKINRALTQEECDSILAENGIKPQEWEGGEDGKSGTLNLASLGYTGEQNDAARKTLAPITYDENGNIIPLSKRFDASNPSVLYQERGVMGSYQQLSSITPEALGKGIITFFSASDISTMGHETGHWLRQVLELGAQSGNEQMTDDWLALCEAYRQPADGSSWSVEAEEKFAHQFTEYLREGKAPSKGLRKAFRSIKRWLCEIYQKLVGRGDVERISPQMREIFDRLLATEQEIEQARQKISIKPKREQTNIPTDMLGDADIERLKAANDKAEASIADAIQQKMLSELKANIKEWRAEGREIAERDEWQVAFDDILKRGGLNLPPEYAESLPKETLDAIKAKRPGKSLVGPNGSVDLDMYADEMGYTGPAAVDNMLRDMASARGKRRIVEDHVQERMREWAGDLHSEEVMLTPEVQDLLGAEAEAIAKVLGTKSVSGDSLAKTVTAEAMRLGAGEVEAQMAGLKAAAKANAEKARAALKAVAEIERLIREREVASTEKRAEADRKATDRWNEAEKEFVVAEQAAKDAERLKAEKQRNASKEAQLRADRDKTAEWYRAENAQKLEQMRDRMLHEALDAKERQRRAVASIRARYNAKEMRRKFEAMVKKGLKTKPESVDWQWMEQFRDVAHTFGIGNGKLNPADEQAMDFRTFLSELEKDWEGPVPVPEWMLATSERAANYKKLTVAQLYELKQVLGWLLHNARNLKTLTMGRDQIELDHGVDMMRDAMSSLKSKKAIADYERKKLSLKGLASRARSAMAGITLFEYAFRAADGFTKGTGQMDGIHSKLIMNPLYEARDNELAMQQEINDKLREILKPFLSGKKRSERWAVEGVAIPDDVRREWGSEWMNWERCIMIALNMGNEGNLKALMTGYGWSREDLDAITARMTDADWTMVQEIWDLIGTMSGALGDTYRKINGVPMNKVQALPLRLQNGRVLGGGYFPLIFDQRFSDKAGRQQEEDALKNSQQAMLRNVKAKDGMTKSRVGGTMPPKLSISVIDQHIGDTIHYITHAEALKQIQKIFNDKRWKAMFEDKFGRELMETLQPWLNNIARPVRPMMTAQERMVEKLRHLATVQAFSFNLKTAALQLTSLSSTASEIGWGRVMQGMMHVITHRGEAMKLMNEMSPFMRNRAETMTRDVAQNLRRTLSADQKSIHWEWNGEQHDMSMQDVEKAAFWLMTMTDAVVAGPSFYGAYLKALEENGGDEKAAVTYAERVVAQAQSAGHMMNLSVMQQGNGVAKLLTMFMTYTMNLQNRIRYNTRGLVEGQISIADYAQWMTNDVVIPACLTVLVTGLLKSGDVPDDPKEYAKEVGYQFLSGFPYLRGFQSAIEYGMGYDLFNSGMNKGFDGMVGMARNAKRWLWEEDSEKAKGHLFKFTKSTLETAGFWLGAPTKPFIQFFNGAWDLTHGKTDNPMALFVKQDKKKKDD